MSSARWLLLVLLLLAVAGGGTVAVRVAKKARGKPVTNAPAGDDGIVRVDPAALAAQAGAPLHVYALARMLASEHPRDSEQIREAVAWAALNHAKGRGLSIVALLLKSKKGDGLFGAQFTGRYATTANDPTMQDLATAVRVLSGAVPDPTFGADQFDSPRAQRAALARSVTGYGKTPEQVAADRLKAGKRMVLLAGVPEETLRFWRTA